VSFKTYYISTNDNSLVTPFTTFPSYCASRLVYSISTSPSTVGTQGNALFPDFSNMKIDYFYDGDTDLSGNSLQGLNYIVTITGTIEDGTASAPSSYILNIRNPCYDSSFFNVVAVTPPSFSYRLFETNPDNFFNHLAFNTNAQPAVKALCGDLKYTFTVA